LTKKRSLVIFMEHFSNICLIDKQDWVFKTGTTTRNADVVLGILREMELG